MSDQSRQLTQNELRDLTGTPRRDRQRQVLDQQGVRYFIRTDGSLATTWEAVNFALTKQQTAAPPRGPSLDWMQP